MAMTVAQLITKLKKIDQKSIVVYTVRIPVWGDDPDYKTHFANKVNVIVHRGKICAEIE